MLTQAEAWQSITQAKDALDGCCDDVMVLRFLVNKMAYQLNLAMSGMVAAAPPPERAP